MDQSNITINKRHSAIAVLGCLVTILFMASTNPQQLSAFMLLALPILVALTSYWLTRTFLETFTAANIQKIKQTALVFSVAPTVLMLLGSLRQLSLQDIALVAVFVSGLGWYLRRRQYSMQR